MEVKSIKRLKGSISVRVQHFLTEENTLASFFANLIFFAGNFQLIHSRKFQTKAEVFST